MGHVSVGEANVSFVRSPGDHQSVDERPARNGTSSSATPEEGLRLIRAFLGVNNAGLRASIIDLATEVSICARDGADASR